MSYPTDLDVIAQFTDEDPNVPGSGTTLNALTFNALVDKLADIVTALGIRPPKLEMFAEDPTTTTGLTWGYKNAVVQADNVARSIVAGTLTLADASTNYVFYNWTANAVQSNTTGFPVGGWPIAQVVTAAGVITGTWASRDKRTWIRMTDGSPVSVENIVVESLTGNGTAGPYTLSATPQKIILLSLRGASLKEGDATRGFTISGANVTTGSSVRFPEASHPFFAVIVK